MIEIDSLGLATFGLAAEGLNDTVWILEAPTLLHLPGILRSGGEPAEEQKPQNPAMIIGHEAIRQGAQAQWLGRFDCAASALYHPCKRVQPLPTNRIPLFYAGFLPILYSNFKVYPSSCFVSIAPDIKEVRIGP